jgi:predicted RNA-binding protein with TRAM domain
LPPVHEGAVREVEIDTLGKEGDGIARVERGFVVFVPGTSPGDVVRIRITDVRDSFAFAKVLAEAGD